MTDGLIWIGVGLALSGGSLLLPGVFLLSLGFAAAVTGLATLGFRCGFAAQAIAFGATSAAALIFAVRARGPRHPAHPAREALVGRYATALVFRGRDGKVRLGDADWPARVPPDIAQPDPGARLRVARVDGTILIVRPDFERV